ncbi:MAG: hypothetical protein L6R35_005702, partial [Caloplaca aegaea]
AVPPYEPNPAYTQQQPHMQHQEYVSPHAPSYLTTTTTTTTNKPLLKSSYNHAPIQPNPQQHQYPQQSPMDPPKQEYYAGQEPTLQHHPSMPMQQAVQQSGYHTATPLTNLESAAAPVDCPCCRMRALTKIECHSGNTTAAWAAILCFCCCLGCIPYMMRTLKDVEHKCGHCGVLLATWHNSGRTVVHQHY